MIVYSLMISANDSPWFDALKSMLWFSIIFNIIKGLEQEEL